MSISFKFVLDQRKPTTTGLYHLKLRIFKERKYKDQSLGIKLAPADWDANNQVVLPSHPQHASFNTRVHTIKARLVAEQTYSLINPSHQKDIQQLLAQIMGKQPVETKAESQCFIDYGIKKVDMMETAGRIGNAIVYRCAINKLKWFRGKRNLPFDEITYKLLNEFNTALLSDGIKINSISNYLRTIRAIYNQGVREGIVSADKYPFRGFKIRSEKTPSRSLTLKEMQNIVELPIPVNTPMWHWRNYFLLSFCMIGVNFADLLTFTNGNIIDGRIEFNRKKTGRRYSINVEPTAAWIINHYRPSASHGYLLPVLPVTNDPVRLKKAINQARKTCNEYLKRIANKCDISKDLTTYYGRYAWANIARSLGYSKDLIAQAMGHEEGNRITSIYLDSFDRQLVDDMNAHIITVVFSQSTSCHPK